MGEVLRIDEHLRVEDLRVKEPAARQAVVAPKGLESKGFCPVWTREAAALALEGWDWQIRLGKRIWRDPKCVVGRGCWTDEITAYEWVSDLHQRDHDREKGVS